MRQALKKKKKKYKNMGHFHIFTAAYYKTARHAHLIHLSAPIVQ